MEGNRNFSNVSESFFTKSKLRKITTLFFTFFLCAAYQVNANTTKNVTSLIEANLEVNKQQQQTISGTVVDEQGSPLPGVAIFVENTNRGVQTDFDGKYSIKVEANDKILVFSFMGFKTYKLEIKGQSIVNVTLNEDSNVLNEVLVVATGYQKISKERATGAFNTMPLEDIENIANDNVASLIEGIIPGVQVAEDADGNISIDDVVVRGVGSIDPESSKAPLVVVDGFPVEGGFTTINPSDIESVTFLKDAAAASIWGVRSGNGVIVVTTKKAKATSGLQIEFKTFVKMNSKLDLDYNLTNANAETSLALESLVYQPGNHGTVPSGFQGGVVPPENLNDLSFYDQMPHGVRAYYDAYKGNITQAELDATINRLRGNNVLDDAQKYMLASPFQQYYNLSLATSSDNSKTRFSISYNDNQNAFVGDENNQLLINLNNQYQIADWLSFNMNGMISNSTSENVGIGYNSVRNLDAYERLVDDNGAYSNVTGGFRDAKYLSFLQNNLENSPYSTLTYNPLRDASDTKNVSKDMDIRINAGLEITILPGLKFKPSYQYETFKNNGRNYAGPEVNSTISSVLGSTDLDDFDPITGRIGDPNIFEGAVLNRGERETVKTTIRSLLTFDKTFGKHELNVLAGWEKAASTTKGSTFGTIYGFDDADNTFQQFQTGEWKSLFGTGGTTYMQDSRGFEHANVHFVSYLGNAAYTFDKKYTISASARADGANFITDDNKERFNPMWSVGLAWNIKEEAFMEDVDFVNNLKLRATNGDNGNLVGSVSKLPTIYLYPSPDYYTGASKAYLETPGTPDIRWERINTLNFGLDFNLFNSKLFGSADYYVKTSRDLMANVDVSPTTGWSNAKYNVGEMENKGIELNIGTSWKFAENLYFTTNVVYSHNNSEVTNLRDFHIFPRSIAGNQYIEGKPYSPAYSWIYNGMQTIPSQPAPYPTIISADTGKVYGMDENIGSAGEDGRDMLEYSGTLVAPTSFGWNASLAYKGFTLRTRLTGQFGHVFRRPTYDYSPTFNGSYHEDVEGLLAGNHDAMGIPKLGMDFDFYLYRWGWYMPQLNTLIEDASHVRLKQVYLSYDLDANYLSSIGLSGIKLFMQADNFGTIWTANKYGIDPQYIGGVSRAPQQAFTFGLDIKF